MGRSGGAAVRIDAGELDHVVRLRRGGEEVAAIVLHQHHAWITHPRAAVLGVDSPEDVEGRAVDLDAGHTGGVEVERGQDVEPAAHPDDQRPWMLDRPDLVGGRVEGSIDAFQRLPAAVVLDHVRERVIVLGEHPLEARGKGRMIAHQHREVRGCRLQRWQPRDLDASDGVPLHVLQAVSLFGERCGQQ